MMVTNQKKIIQNNIVSLLILMTLVGSVGLFFNSSFKSQKELEITINLAGRQRMLSQRIASQVSQYRNGDKKILEDLKVSLKLFQESHNSLLKTYEKGLIPKSDLREIYYGKQKSLNNKVAIYINQVESFIKLPLRSKKSNIYLKKIITQANNGILNELDEVVSVYEKAGKSKLKYLFTVYLIMFFAVLGICIIYFRNIVDPLIQNIQNLNLQIANSQLMDSLTQIPNRKHFFNLGEVEVLRSRRFNRALTILLLDIDYFKNFNDQNSFHDGDKLVLNITRIIKNNMRTIDLLGRMEDGNFAILLPETNINQAIILADRLRKVIGAENFVTSKSKNEKVTVSIGLAEVKYATSGIEQGFKDAETNLFFAKESGRNAIIPNAA